MENDKELYRECHCSEPKCIKEWNESAVDENSDTDSDFLTNHCACHNISLGKTSAHCYECTVWVCQNCSVLTMTNFNQELDEDDDDITDDVICEECYTTWAKNKLILIQSKKKKYEKQMQELQEVLDNITEKKFKRQSSIIALN